MDPVPDIGTTPQPEDVPPSGGMASRQRQAQQARKRAFIKKKEAGQNGPSPVPPGIGAPDLVED